QRGRRDLQRDRGGARPLRHRTRHQRGRSAAHGARLGTHRTRGARPRHERKRRMSEQPTTAAAPAEQKPRTPLKRLFSGSGSLLIGLVVALIVLIVFGAIASPDNFPTTGNMLTILRQASIIGVI